MGTGSSTTSSSTSCNTLIVPEDTHPFSEDIFHNLQSNLVSKWPERNFVFCNKFVRFIPQKDYWSCGYRNLQMVASSLLAGGDVLTKQRLFGGVGFVPDVKSLQHILENAWKLGFDEEGANHYQGSIKGKREWIGTTEVAAIFRSCGVACDVYDFDYKSKSYSSLLAFVWEYFARGDTYPLYFQYKGHSSTIVGVERGATGQISLFLFNPLMTMEQANTSSVNNPYEFVCTATDRDEYEIVAFRTGKRMEFDSGLEKVVRAMKPPPSVSELVLLVENCAHGLATVLISESNKMACNKCGHCFQVNEVSLCCRVCDLDLCELCSKSNHNSKKPKIEVIELE